MIPFCFRLFRSAAFPSFFCFDSNNSARVSILESCISMVKPMCCVGVFSYHFFFFFRNIARILIFSFSCSLGKSYARLTIIKLSPRQNNFFFYKQNNHYIYVTFFINLHNIISPIYHGIKIPAITAASPVTG